MSQEKQILNLQNANLGTVLLTGTVNRKISGILAIEDLAITSVVAEGNYADLAGVTIPAGVYVPGIYTQVVVGSGTGIGVIKQ